MEPIRVLMSVRSLVHVVVWTAIVVTIVVVMVMARVDGHPSPEPAGDASSMSCTS